MSGSSASFHAGRGAKLLAGFFVYIVVSMLICHDSWVLGTSRGKPVSEMAQTETQQSPALNQDLQFPSESLSPSSLISYTESFSFPFHPERGVFPFLKNESLDIGEKKLSFLKKTRKAESEPLWFSYWEELRDGTAADGTHETTPDEKGAEELPRIAEKTAKFKKGDNFFRKAVKLGLPRDTTIEIIESIRKKLDLRSIAVGDTLTLKRWEDTSEWFELAYEKKNDFRVVVTQDADGYSVSKKPVVLMPKLCMVEGSIDSSLYADARKAGLSPALILKLVEIFSWDVDFLVDLRKGDSFKVIYESWYREGEHVRDGVILAARFVNEDRVMDAFWFQEEDGREGYFDPDGRNLRKAFLRSPLKYTRISSSFSYKRFHPVLKVYRPHLGIDYAAPGGTPVQTIGDGKVIFRGWKSGFGRFVKIRHNNGIVSCYGHLRGFAKSLSTGKRVRQGQLIGWVGQSGLATGPHLDFRMIVGGQHVNPLKVLKESPPVKSLSPDHKREFEKRVAKYELLLEGVNRLAAAE